MFGIDEYLSHLTDNALLFVLIVSVLLGLRHATDPDHLSAMLTLRLEKSQRDPRRIGLAWGVGHAVTMIAVGIPLIVLVSELPSDLQKGLEFSVGIMIIVLSLKVIWGATKLSSHTHEHTHHDLPSHYHVHTHGSGEHNHRTERGAFAIGLLHGAGGSAGVVALILGRLENPLVAAASLVVISVFSAASMIICSWIMCRSLDRTAQSIGQKPIALIGGGLTFLFGLWYCGAALETVPYPF